MVHASSKLHIHNNKEGSIPILHLICLQSHQPHKRRLRDTHISEVLAIWKMRATSLHRVHGRKQGVCKKLSAALDVALLNCQCCRTKGAVQDILCTGSHTGASITDVERLNIQSKLVGKASHHHAGPPLLWAALTMTVSHFMGSCNAYCNQAAAAVPLPGDRCKTALGHLSINIMNGSLGWSKSQQGDAENLNPFYH